MSRLQVPLAPHRDSIFRTTVRKLGKRWLAWRFRHFDPDREVEREAKVAGMRLRVLPEVFNPALHFTSAFFARYLVKSGIITAECKVLDLGTGSGILAIAAARAGAASVTAVDINPAAAASARHNARINKVSSIVTVIEGDMFDSMGELVFDVVVCNPPYLRGEPKSIAGYAYWGGKELEWLSRFGRGLHEHLASHGTCIISIGDAGDLRGVIEILQGCGWEVTEAARRDILFEIIYLLRLTKASSAVQVENSAPHLP